MSVILQGCFSEGGHTLLCHSVSRNECWVPYFYTRQERGSCALTTVHVIKVHIAYQVARIIEPDSLDHGVCVAGRHYI